MPLLFAMLFGASLTLLESWVFMLLVGALHSRVDAVPAVGYSASVLVICLVHVVALVFARSRES